MRRNGLRLHQGRFRLGIMKTSLKEWLGTGTAAQGGGGVTDPGGVQCGDVALRDVAGGQYWWLADDWTG